jgi:hypothetical protein
MEEELIVNRFEQVLGHWICLHDEDLHFNPKDNHLPQIKLCGQTLRIRANDAWSRLPQHQKEAQTAHELGHLELGHASVPMNPLFRLGCVMNGTVSARELEADRYACKLVGRASYLRALTECAEQTFSPTARAELLGRIRALKGSND